MADTQGNQAAFPQPRSQKFGLGFPICRLLATLCLFSGAVLDAETSATLSETTQIDPDASTTMRHLVGKRRVGKRPGRIEPYVIKRRPKTFPLLTQNCDLVREEMLLNVYT